MKFTFILLTAAMLSVHATGVSQKVTIDVKQSSLAQLFRDIEQKTNYVFFYKKDALKHAKPVSLKMENASIETVLAMALRNQPYRFSIRNSTVIITKNEDAKSTEENSVETFPMRAPSPIKGDVTGPDGKPIAGAAVMIKGTRRGISTDEKGHFTIEAKIGDVLVITSIGYANKEIRITEDSYYSIQLVVSTSPLDEVQIIAYGESSKRLNTGNVATVTANEIQNQPVINPLEALKGRVAGLEILPSSGIPGMGVTVRIRGQNSLRDDQASPIQSLNMNAPVSGNTPLFIVDGVPISSAGVGLLGGQFFGAALENGVNPLNTLSPSDIERIDVLKDAAATSIYGSIGANGVILITTKKGKSGKSKIDLNFSQGIGEVTRKMKVLNRRQYLDMRYEAYRNDGIDFTDPSVFDARDLKEWDTVGRNVDWQKELLGEKAEYSNAQLSFSGGNAQTSFRAGGGWQRQTSVFAKQLAYTRGSGNLQVNHQSENRKFFASFSTLINSDRNTLPREDLTQKALLIPPIGPSLFLANGNLNWADYPDHPIAGLQGSMDVRTNALNTSAQVRYQLLQPFSLKLNMGYTRQTVSGNTKQPATAVNPDWLPFYGDQARTVIYDESLIATWIAEPQAEYGAKLGPGKLNALLGGTFRSSSNQYNYLFTTGYPIDEQMNNRGFASQSQSNEAVSEYRYTAIFSRFNYNISNKYLIDLTARRDGSSRFAAGNQFGNFGALGAAWLFSEEAAIKKVMPALSFGKLRFSYGSTGSDNIGDYMFQNVYSAVQGITPYDGMQILRPQRLPSTEYKWETNRKLDGEINLGLFNDRLLTTITYYTNTSSNQLVGFPISAITGFTDITRNLPATIRNSGWELVLQTQNIATKRFSWNSSINLTLPKNRLVKYPDLDISPYEYRYAIGYSTNIQKTFDWLFVDPQNGLNVYQDEDGKQVLDPFNEIGEGNIIIDRAPKYYGGFSNTIQYGDLSLDIFFQFGSRNGLLMPDIFIAQESGNMRNQSVHYFNNRWQQPGDNSLYPKFTSFLGNGNTIGLSEQNFGTITFARLSNLALNYQLPLRFQQKMQMQGGRIFLQAQNVLTLSKYKGLDPETLSASLPPLRIITLGAQISF